MRPRTRAIVQVLLIFLAAANFFPLLLSAMPDPANWSVTLESADQSGAPGSTLVYSGTIANNTGTDIILDLANVSFHSGDTSAFSVGLSDAFLSTAGDIPFDGFSGPLFFVDVLAAASAGSAAQGSLDFTAEGPASPDILSTAFGAAVITSSGTPEPGTLGLVFAGVLAGTILLGCRRLR